MSFSPIAIVGRACVVPGALTPDALWNAARDGKDLISRVDDDRWGVAPGTVLAKPGESSEDRTWSDRGGYVRGFSDVFEPEGFEVSSRDICALDPQFQWVFHTARQALSQAGRRGRVGAIFGNLSFPTASMSRFAESVWAGEVGPDPRNRFMSGLPALMLERGLRMEAGAFALDAACASSIYAIKLACDWLHDRRADTMLAGAVNCADDLFIHIGFSALNALSKTGRSRPFHAQADGLLPAEGAAFVGLRRLEDAVRDDDQILAVIRGIGLSNDGRGRGLLVPCAEGQVRAIQQAYDVANIDAKSVSLLECHATGTPVGDSTEVKSLGRVFSQATDIPIASLKSNLGHLITAAGVAGLIKVIEGMQAGLRAPTLYTDQPIDALDGSPFRLIHDAEAWDDPLRRAGVSAFGFGGNNAHLVVEAYREDAQPIAPLAPPTGAIHIVGVGAIVGDASTVDEVRRVLFEQAPWSAKSGAIDLELRGLKFPPNDLKQTLPQQLILLKVVKDALANAPSLPTDRTGVFVGMGADPEVARYGARWRLGAHDAVDVLKSPGVLGTMPNVVTNRLNSQFDLKGPSFSVCAEENSGLFALEIAVRALQAKEIDAAIVASVDMSHEPVHAAAASAVLPAERQCPTDAAVALVLSRDSVDAYATIDSNDIASARDTNRAEINRIENSSSENLSNEQKDVHFQIGGIVTERLGHAHAASGLVQVLAATLSLRHRAHPDGTPWLEDGRRACVDVTAMEGQKRQVRLTQGEPGRAARPVVRTFCGRDTRDVLAALEAGHESNDGPARLVVVGDIDQQKPHARALLTGRPVNSSGIQYRETPLTGEIAHVFASAGSAYFGMGRELLHALPELAERLTQRFRGLSPALSWAYSNTKTATESLALTILQKLWGASALCQLHSELTLGLLGLKPSVAMGFSSGETNALFAFGAWRDLDAMVAASKASNLFEAVNDWAVWTVCAPVEAIRDRLASQAEVRLAAIHTDKECLIAGPAAACTQIVGHFGRTRCVRVDYDLPVHVPELETVRPQWQALHRREVYPVNDVRFYSSALHEAYPLGMEQCARAITEQAMATVDFPKTVLRAYEDGVRIFIEHGPQGVTGRWIREILGDRPVSVVSLDRKGGGISAIHDAVASLMAAGVVLDHSAIFGSAEPTEPVLRFESHAPSVELESSTPTGKMQIMEPAPSLAPVVDWEDPSFSRPRAQVQQNVAHRDSSVVVSHADSDRRAASTDHVDSAVYTDSNRHAFVDTNDTPAADVYGRLKSYYDQLGTIHRTFIATQTEVHHQFLRFRQNASLVLLQPPPGPVASDASLSPAVARAPALNPAWVRAPAPSLAPVTTRAPAPTPVASVPLPYVETDARIDIQRTEQRSAFYLDRQQLEIHAGGKISSLFGPAFSAQDRFLRQVRMPEPPLLLADRVTDLRAEPGSMGLGTIWTETDVRPDAWYLNEGYMPAGIMIESGQADLLLISYLGVDLLNKGERVYRLLGCELTYHGNLPCPGETLRYDIHVDGHANHQDTRLFFFHYDCVVDGQPRLTVRHGQAGFFSDQELAESAGVVWSPEDQKLTSSPRLDKPEQHCKKQRFSADDLHAFSEGRGSDCFGSGFEFLKTHVRTPKFQSGQMQFLDEITDFHPHGGPHQRGYLRAETQVSPDDWFFDGHFKNDPCMPGTLMFEGCLQGMSFYLAGLGFTLRRDGWRFQPVQGQPVQLQCRGQVTPQSKCLVYEVFVDEVLSGPRPTLFADLVCTIDGLKAFHACRMGLELVPDWPITSIAHHEDGSTGLQKVADARPVAEAGGFPFDYKSLLACAWGKPSDAFGPMYSVFDGHRRVARLPGPPYHFMSRVTRVDGEIGVVESGAKVEIEYDIPDDAWYFDANGVRTMPFAVLLEAALQPCGWLASFVGSALTVDEDLSFRNLDGTGTLLSELTAEDSTLRTVVTVTNISQTAKMLIESFEVECFVEDRKVYDMSTVFGFFPGAALENQVGLPTTDEQRAVLTQPTDTVIDLSKLRINTSDAPPLANSKLLMLDRVTGFWPNGGPKGLGELRAEKDVDPGEWFFKAHFFQDPVQPGSLGLEAMVQLLQVFMLQTHMHDGIADPAFESLATNVPLSWKYRGQVVPSNRMISTTLQVVETGHDDRGVFAIANASLWVDGKRIYEATNLGMRIISNRAAVDVEIIDPTKDAWINDHCPTWTVPALPMMSIVDRLASGRDVVGLKDVRVKEWVVVDRPRRLQIVRSGSHASMLCDNEEVATAEILTGAYPPRPEAWPSIEGMPVPSPYDTGELFHGPAFAVLTRLVRSEEGASAILSAESGVPFGSLNQALLDGATHAIVHEHGDKVAYPALISELTMFGPAPTTGDIRCEVRLDGTLGKSDFFAYRIQLIDEDGVWLQMRLVEACFDKGRLGAAAPLDRRTFLRNRTYVPGVRLSETDGVLTRLNQSDVDGSNWLPGTIERVYGSTDATEIAIKETLAAELRLHPHAMPRALPITRVSHTASDGALSVQTELEFSAVRAFWTEWFDRGPWPVEDLYYGLIERFINRVVVTDPDAFDAVKEQSVVYLANHQVGLESLLFSVLTSGLTRVPTVTLAKIEHKDTWLGQLIAHAFAYPGVKDPKLITFFDRNDQASLPKLIGQLAEEMATGNRSVMVHVEGTRSLSCGTEVRKMSGAFIDMALKVGAPIVPVRFIGGLGQTPVEKRLEFPLDMGRQDIWLGRPLLPSDLASLPYGERKKRVLAEINSLGVANVDERPFAGQVAFAERVRQWQSDTGVSEEHAVLATVLRQVADPCDETKQLLRSIESGSPSHNGWIDELAARLYRP